MLASRRLTQPTLSPRNASWTVRPPARLPATTAATMLVNRSLNQFGSSRTPASWRERPPARGAAPRLLAASPGTRPALVLVAQLRPLPVATFHGCAAPTARHVLANTCRTRPPKRAFYTRRAQPRNTDRCTVGCRLQEKATARPNGVSVNTTATTSQCTAFRVQLTNSKPLPRFDSPQARHMTAVSTLAFLDTIPATIMPRIAIRHQLQR